MTNGKNHGTIKYTRSTICKIPLVSGWQDTIGEWPARYHWLNGWQDIIGEWPAGCNRKEEVILPNFPLATPTSPTKRKQLNML